MNDLPTIEPEPAIAYLLRFLSVEGTTGNEERIGLEIAAALGELGVPASAMHFDDVRERIPLPTEAGNLIVKLDGEAGLPRRLFMAHRDTVPLCAGVRPRREGERIVSAAPTALGGDDRAGVACLVNMVAVLKRHRLPHPPLTLLFTVREESGLWGARTVDFDLLDGPEFGFNLDGASPSKLFVGAVGGARWEATVEGRSAHAGLYPERGVSAPLVAAIALATVQRRGWWGKIRRGDRAGTSNVGTLAGRDGGAVGGATNVVTDYVAVEGEARSHDSTFIPRIVAAYHRAFEHAVTRVRDDQGGGAKLTFRSETMYDPFRLPPSAPVVRFALERGAAAGLQPTLEIANGGLDANWMVKRGLPTVTFGPGQRNVHTTEEYVDLPDYLAACRLAVALARA